MFVQVCWIGDDLQILTPKRMFVFAWAVSNGRLYSNNKEGCLLHMLSMSPSFDHDGQQSNTMIKIMLKPEQITENVFVWYILYHHWRTDKGFSISLFNYNIIESTPPPLLLHTKRTCCIVPVKQWFTNRPLYCVILQNKTINTKTV